MTDHILVIKHSAFGDFIQALGCMRAIRARHANARITLMTTTPFSGLAQASGYFDDVYVDVRPKWYQPQAWLRLRAWLNGQGFTHVYDLQNSERTEIYFRLFKHRPAWSGIARGASQQVPDDAARHTKHVFAALVDQLAVAGIEHVVPDDLSWMQADVAHFRLRPPYVLVAAGCSAKHLAKRWPVERYAAVCTRLVARGFTPVLLGTRDESDVTAAIKTACTQAVDLTGQTTLFDIAVLARGAAAAIGNDTGPTQMIGPTGCKTLGLYPGFSNPVRHGPLGAHVVTMQKDTMAGITTDSVCAALSSLLAVAI